VMNNKELVEKYNYMTKDEQKFDRKMFDLQVTLGLQTCKTKGEVVKLLHDVRLHERRMIKEQCKRITCANCHKQKVRTEWICAECYENEVMK